MTYVEKRNRIRPVPAESAARISVACRALENPDLVAHMLSDAKEVQLQIWNRPTSTRTEVCVVLRKNEVWLRFHRPLTTVRVQKAKMIPATMMYTTRR